MHDDLVDGRRRQQLATFALVAGLGALAATRRVLATLRRTASRIGTRRLRRVARRALDLTLKLSDPFLLPGHALHQPPDLLVHPQQHRDDDLLALLVNRLSLSPLHATGFAAAALCPPDQLNAYT